MTERYRRFAEYYAQTANATEAAKLAGYSPRTARSQGQCLLTKVDIQEYIRELQEQAASERIADMGAVKEFWSNVMNDEKEKTADRLKASELLAKSAGAFLDRIEVDNPDRDDVVIYLPSNGREPHIEEDNDT